MNPTLPRDQAFVARLLVWLALCVSLLGYIRWGTELTSVTSFYFIRRSVPEIWGYFRKGMPEIGNSGALDAVYWASIGAVLVGVLALIWLAMEPEQRETEPEGIEI